MSNLQDDTGTNQEKPIFENEAIKNTEEVFDDKKNKSGDVNEKFPGYPQYPASEDIMNPSSQMERVETDIEQITRNRELLDTGLTTGANTATSEEGAFPVDDTAGEDEIGIVPGTEADVTEDDLLALGALDEDMDMGDDEALKGKGFALDRTGDDLDVPGEELDDADEAIGEEDEENNYYSLGGDEKEG